MEALELKIFDVLVEKITVLEFENWLYESEEIIGDIELNALYFDAITINYRSKTWEMDLNAIAINHLGEKCCEILEIWKVCTSIIKSETFSETHNVLYGLAKDFDYETDYSIVSELYVLRDYFDLVSEGVCEIGTFKIEADFYSRQTLEIIQENQNFDETKTALERNLKGFKNYKQ